MADQQQPRGVHLNGSIPLANAEEVFRVTGSILGERLHRIPDGETGVRSNWISWQSGVFEGNPSLEMVPPDPNAYVQRPHFKLRPGVSDIAFDTLGYADAALASYTVFARLKQSGAIPAQYRFQVSLPTPLAPVTAFIVDEERTEVQTGIREGHVCRTGQDRIRHSTQ